MSNELQAPADAPHAIQHWLSAIPSALIPGSVKALSRLIGAIADYPAALLERETAKVKSHSRSLDQVESAIAKVAACEAAGDEAIVARAVETLVRKQYRKQVNRDAIAVETMKLLTDGTDASGDAVGTESGDPGASPEEAEAALIDDDWLNIFERFAEDASSERMQGLWSRVLAGEIRKPGRYSSRTLRFLSEFSQADALSFEEYARIALFDFIPKSLAIPETKKNIADLLDLEAAGLISDPSGLGLTRTSTFSASGLAYIIEGDFILMFRGIPGTTMQVIIIGLTPLGREVLHLMPGRDILSAMRLVGKAMKSEATLEATIGRITGRSGANIQFQPLETLWS